MRGIAVFLLPIVLLAACAAPPDTAVKVSPSAGIETGQSESMQASMLESSARPLLEAEILSAYERALRAYGWFDLSPLPASEDTAIWGGVLYHRVDMDGIESLEDLRTYLRSVFSQELTDRLLDGGTARIQYRDIDGVLYFSGTGRDQDASVGAIQIETEQVDETVYYVNVLVDLLAGDQATVLGQESWSFPYTYEGDRWVFTDFSLFY